VLHFFLPRLHQTPNVLCTHSYYHGPLDTPSGLDPWLLLGPFFALSQQEVGKEWISTSHLPNGS
jgi:hypothetical protein